MKSLNNLLIFASAVVMLCGCHRNNSLLSVTFETKHRSILIGGQSNAVWLYQYGLSGFHSTDTVFTFESCAVGATNATQWLPGEPLYQACIDLMKDKPIDAIIWLQGEAEAVSLPPAGQNWDQLFMQTVSGFRHDLGKPNLPVFFERLSDGCQYGPSWTTVYNVQSAITQPNIQMVSLDGLHCDPTNYPHYRLSDYPLVAERFSQSLMKFNEE